MKSGSCVSHVTERSHSGSGQKPSSAGDDMFDGFLCKLLLYDLFPRPEMDRMTDSKVRRSGKNERENGVIIVLHNTAENRASVMQCSYYLFPSSSGMQAFDRPRPAREKKICRCGHPHSSRKHTRILWRNLIKTDLLFNMYVEVLCVKLLFSIVSAKQIATSLPSSTVARSPFAALASLHHANAARGVMCHNLNLVVVPYRIL